MRTRFAVVLFVAAVCAALFAQGTGGGHVLTGHVREEGTDAPLQSVELEILSSGTRAAPSTTTGIDGEFKFGGLRDGEYFVSATKRGYETATLSVTILAGSEPPLVISMRKVGASASSGKPGDAISARQLSIPERARESFEKGRKLLYENSAPAKAIPLFERAIQEYPSYYEAYAQIGVANYRMGTAPPAEAALRKSIELSSGKYPESLFLLATLFNDQGRFQEAEPLARQAVALDDSSWHGHFELARALVGLKRPSEAEPSARRAIYLNPQNSQTFLVLSNIHLQERQYAAVVQDFDGFLKLAPTGPQSDMIRKRREQLKNALQQAEPAPH